MNANEKDFLERLNCLKDKLDSGDSLLSDEDIKEHFKGVALDDNKLALIKNYLKYRISDNKNYKDYEERDKEIYPDELIEDISQAIFDYINYKDDVSLKNILSPFLKNSGLWIEEFKKEGLDEEDLTQEAALALSEYILSKAFLENIEEKLDLADAQALNIITYDIAKGAKEACDKALNEFLARDEASFNATNKVLKRVNEVNDAAIKYKEEFGIKPTPSELGYYIEVSEEYIIDTIQMSGYLIDTIDFDSPINEYKKKR